MKIKVSEAMSKNPIVISPNEFLPSCARKMLINNVGGILIVKNSKLYGIVTEKDIVERAVAKELDVKKVKVEDIMSVNMVTISPEADLQKAIEIDNKEDIRRLAVTEKDKLVGLLTMKDTLRKEPELIKSIKEDFLKRRKK